MKLLFDQNLAPSLTRRLSDVFPGSEHVFQLGLGEASDDEIWEFAKQHGFTVVTKDADYNQLSVLRGSPAQGDLAGHW